MLASYSCNNLHFKVVNIYLYKMGNNPSAKIWCIILKNPDGYKGKPLRMRIVSKDTELKKCNSCKQIMPISEFTFRKYSQKGKKYQRYDTHCKICFRVYRSKFPSREKNTKSKYDTEYTKNNKEKVKKRHSIYYAKNKDVIHQKRRKYYQNHPDKKIALYCRKRVADLFKSGRDFPNLIGCDTEFLYNWFTFLLVDNPTMTMENHGTYWHIDHVIPCAKWDMYDEEQKKKCFHWTNLAPLEASENISKSNKIIPKYIEKQNNMIQLFSEKNDVNYPLLECKFE
jgi:hypothetical protein